MATVAGVRVRPRRARGLRARRRQVAGFLFVLPSVAFVAIFFIIPLIMTGWIGLGHMTLDAGGKDTFLRPVSSTV